MEKELHEIHQEVFDFLMRYYKAKKLENKEFYFRLRKINRGGMLDKGYWFLGNEKLIRISFWNGFDLINRIPNISFVITKYGKTYLEFSNIEDSSIPKSFTNDIIDDFRVKNHLDSGNRKINYDFSNAKYLDSLRHFIENEKVRIDELVEQNKIIGIKTHFSDEIGPIWPKNFEDQLKLTEKFIVDKKNKIANSGSLHEIQIKNFGPIENVLISEIKNDCRWIFITGENGSGKSSLLKAIAAGLCQNNDLNESIATEAKFGKFSISLKYYDWDRSLITYKLSCEDSFLDKKIIPKVFAAYGPVRLVLAGEIDTTIFKGNTNNQEKVTYGLFNTIGILKDLSEGFLLKAKLRNLLEERLELIENCIEIIPNIGNIEFGNNGKMLFYEYTDDKTNIKEDPILFENLPSGTRNFVALIFDMLIRFQNQQPEISDPADYNGIVLIDEIDIHLHPKFQLEIVRQLSETFPKVQFIVSTHSPIPLLAAPQNSVFIKTSKSNEHKIQITRLKKLENEIHQLLPNSILTSDIFDFDIYENMDENQFNNLALEDNYSDIEKMKEIDERLSKIDADIFPDNLFETEE